MRKIMILSLVVNVVACGIILLLWIVPSFELYLSDIRRSGEIGMKPYMRRKPFTLLVDQKFPANASFTLGVDGIPVVYMFKKNDDSVTAKICVGLDAEVAITFSDPMNPKIHAATLINKGKVFQDIGADGTYDQTLSLAAEAEPTQ
jgi:hypothetical protein